MERTAQALCEKAIAEWLMTWFKKRGVSVKDDLNTNYFESGWIDSLEMIELIMDIEENFSIRFRAGHFQDRRFSSIEGLSGIIAGLLARTST